MRGAASLHMTNDFHMRIVYFWVHTLARSFLLMKFNYVIV